MGRRLHRTTTFLHLAIALVAFRETTANPQRVLLRALYFLNSGLVGVMALTAPLSERLCRLAICDITLFPTTAFPG